MPPGFTVSTLGWLALIVAYAAEDRTHHTARPGPA